MEVLFRKVYENTSVDFFDDKNSIVEKPKDHLDFLDEFTVSHGKKFKYLSTVKNNEEVFKSNYGNPFCYITINRRTVVIEENEEKISLKLFIFTKWREVSKVYFKKDSMFRYVTYNKKTGEVFSGHVRNHHKKRKKVSGIKRNYFYGKPFETLFSLIVNALKSVPTTPTITETNANAENIMSVIRNIIYQKSNYDQSSDLTLNEHLYKVYLDKKGVKYPNNFSVFYNIVPLISKRELKKSKFKMVDAVMKRFELKGDKMKKVLHQIGKLNMSSLRWTLNFFGSDFIHQKDEKFLLKLFETQIYFQSDMDICDFTKQEKNNCFEIFNLLIEHKIEQYTFLDHIYFYQKLKKFENIKWKSKTLSELNYEHINWSEKVDYYTNATYKRYYDGEFIDEIEKPITIFDEIYYPIILNESKNYIEESRLQSNCVKTYVDRASSLIISYRKNSPDSEDRATIEYRIRKVNDRITLKRVQTLGKFNQMLDNTWNYPVELLDNKVFDNVDLLKNISIDKITVIDKTTLKGIFTENNNELVWDINEEINNNFL